jgi:hypothetical protein
MNSRSITRGITLLGFVFLLTSFLLYRMGKFDVFINNNLSPVQTSPNGGAINTTTADTSKPQKDSAERLRLSSSKSVVLIEKKPLQVDSTKKKYGLDDKKMKEMELLSSSKSGYVFKPRYPAKDSLRKDSLKKQMLKQRSQ